MSQTALDEFDKAVKDMSDQELLETMRAAVEEFRTHVGTSNDHARQWLIALIDEWDRRHG